MNQVRGKFNFRLTDSQRDRVVAARLDELRSRGENVSEYVKSLVYEDAIGRNRQSQVLQIVSDIRDMIRSGALVSAETGEPVGDDDRFSALDNFGT